MPGADLSMSIDRIEDRGLRSPRHVGNLAFAGPQTLRPFMAAPLRPGETLAGISVSGMSMLNSMVNIPMAPLTFAELGYWIVPISSLAPWFQSIFTETAEDLATRGGVTTNAGRTILSQDPGDFATQGHLTVGPQTRPRPWAGEIGGDFDAGTNDLASAYMPYVSHATNKVADTWYDRSSSSGPEDELRDNVAPGIGRFIRSALTEGFPLDEPGIDDTTPGSLSQIVEGLFLLTQAEKTYAEYLAGHGVDPRRVQGLPMPVMVEQHRLTEHIPGHMSGPVLAAIGTNEGLDSGIESGYGSEDFSSVVISDTDAGMLYANRPSGFLKTDWSAFRTRNLFIEEPSILLGTMCWWNTRGERSNYGHVMEITRMLNSGHWGDSTFGGIEEEDFLTVQDIYDRAGTDEAAGPQSQTGTQNVFNLLNLFLHGEEFTDHDNDAQDAFGYRQPGGVEIPTGRNSSVTHKLSTQLHILSDLVA